MGPFYERRREGTMYPDERRGEYTFIEIEVIEKAVGFINNDSIHKHIHTENTNAAHRTPGIKHCYTDI